MVSAVALNGKTTRRRRGRRRDRAPLHLVSTWVVRQRLLLGQEAAGDASDEIEAIRALLDKLALDGVPISIDAIGCRHDVAETIIGRGGEAKNPSRQRPNVRSLIPKIDAASAWLNSCRIARS
jgi:hypothetical protein